MRVRRTDEDAWASVASRCPYATFFQTPAWYRVFSQYLPRASAVALEFTWANGHKGIFPYLEIRNDKGRVVRRQSSPAGCYGGWISADSLDADEIGQITAWVTAHCPRMYWRLNPYAPPPGLALGHCEPQPDTTDILRLDQFGDEQALRKHYRSSVRTETGKGARANLCVKAASSWDDWMRYFEIYQQVLARWADKATSNYGIELFRILSGLQGQSVVLWTVLYQDRAIGGQINLYHRGHCAAWHAAFDAEYFRLGLTNFLQHRLILDALERGCSVYDFNPSGGHAGVKAFKAAFRPQQLACPMLITPTRVSPWRLISRFFRRFGSPGSCVLWTKADSEPGCG